MPSPSRSKVLLPFTLLFAALHGAGASAGAELLLQSGKSWDGGGLRYPHGEPVISVYRVTLEEGEQTPFHCHPVPTFGYLLKGTLEVKTDTGLTTVIEEGQAAVEVMNTNHRGRALEGAVEILVFYAGAGDLENTLPEGQCE